MKRKINGLKASFAWDWAYLAHLNVLFEFYFFSFVAGLEVRLSYSLRTSWTLTLIPLLEVLLLEWDWILSPHPCFDFHLSSPRMNTGMDWSDSISFFMSRPEDRIPYLHWFDLPSAIVRNLAFLYLSPATSTERPPSSLGQHILPSYFGTFNPTPKKDSH